MGMLQARSLQTRPSSEYSRRLSRKERLYATRTAIGSSLSDDIPVSTNLVNCGGDFRPSKNPFEPLRTIRSPSTVSPRHQCTKLGQKRKSVRDRKRRGKQAERDLLGDAVAQEVNDYFRKKEEADGMIDKDDVSKKGSSAHVGKALNSATSLPKIDLGPLGCPLLPIPSTKARSTALIKYILKAGPRRNKRPRAELMDTTHFRVGPEFWRLIEDSRNDSAPLQSFTPPIVQLDLDLSPKTAPKLLASKPPNKAICYIRFPSPDIRVEECASGEDDDSAETWLGWDVDMPVIELEDTSNSIHAAAPYAEDLYPTQPIQAWFEQDDVCTAMDSMFDTTQLFTGLGQGNFNAASLPNFCFEMTNTLPQAHEDASCMEVPLLGSHLDKESATESIDPAAVELPAESDDDDLIETLAAPESVVNIEEDTFTFSNVDGFLCLQEIDKDYNQHWVDANSQKGDEAPEETCGWSDWTSEDTCSWTDWTFDETCSWTEWNGDWEDIDGDSVDFGRQVVGFEFA